ncbi:MAG: radical SAM protein [Myxococcales bacterium]|nr:radical SAM protein [Myxococcales bacterium]
MPQPRSLHHRRARLLNHGRVAKALVQSAANPYRPLMAHMVVTRRCNLSCGYCHEYDKGSLPVPIETLKARVRRLAALDTVFVTLTGGETLLHPDIVELVAYVRDQGMTPVMNSNGLLLSPRKIRALGRAGLYAMQISIDNVEPDEVSKKSLRPLLPKLRALAELATFRVRVNSVLGTGNPEEAVAVALAVTELGFDAKCSLVRDAHGAGIPLSDAARAAYDEIRALNRRTWSLSEDFQLALIENKSVSWKCRSGARYFTICEDGLVHLCESSYGTPAKPLELYGLADIREAFHREKTCADTCAVAYAHQASRMDSWRDQGEVQRVEKCSWREAEDSSRTYLPVMS